MCDCYGNCNCCVCLSLRLALDAYRIIVNISHSHQPDPENCRRLKELRHCPAVGSSKGNQPSWLTNVTWKNAYRHRLLRSLDELGCIHMIVKKLARMASSVSTTAGSLSPPRHTVIIGGGIVGASTLYYASKNPIRGKSSPPSRLTLIEASSELAPGASGKSGGFLALDWHGTATSSLAELSYRLHREIAKEGNGGERWGYRAVEVRAGTGLHVAPSLSWLAAD